MRYHMLGIEWENFEKLDNKEYIVKRNPKFLSHFNRMRKKNFSTILSLNEIQDLINQITRFYEFKYPSKMLDSVGWVSREEDAELDRCIQLSKLLDMKQLQYQLRHDQLSFLKCSYGGMITLTKNDSYDFPHRKLISVDSEGVIDDLDIWELKKDEFLEDTEQIESVEDLYSILQRNPQKIDYQELEKRVLNHKDSIVLRDETLKLVMLSLLYANGDLPSKGYARAKSFMRSFNREYDANLNMKRLDEIMSIDYKNTKEVKRYLKSRR